ncbi:FtsK/SpoIIIE family DNA translocase [Cerasicoccus maritimus]|uniref:FtsK/SpoIIIE family DNA translocase n=1 Tax=Cerasicoccus maritimus TaxID=490089 RepID=UPI0028529AF4|nr:DNA translocase FtsK 4TM domain-containing protein [Cerasicoccus maritimus]
MAGSGKKKQPAPQKKSFAPREKSRPLLGIVLLLVGLFLLVAMIDFEPLQSDQFVVGDVGEGSTNLAGEIGVKTSALMLRMFGLVSWLVPVAFIWVAYLLIFKRAHRVRLRLYLSMALFFLSVTGIAMLFEQWGAVPPDDASTGVQVAKVVEAPESSSYPQGLGGLLGQVLCNSYTVQYLGSFGNALLLAATMFFSSLFLFTDNISAYLRNRQVNAAARADAKAKQKAAFEKQRARDELEAKRVVEQEEKKKKTLKKPPTTKKAILADDGPKNPRKPLALGTSILGEPEPAVDDYVPEAEQFSLEEEEIEIEEEIIDAPPTPPKPKPKAGETRTPFSLPPRPNSTTPPFKNKDGSTNAPFAKKTTPPFRKVANGEDDGKVVRRVAGITIVESEKTEKADSNRPDRRGDYIFPPLDLLADPPSNAHEDPQNYEEMANQLVQTLEEFNVKVAPAEVLTGPVITRYEVTPAPGVRVEKILNLDKNIALGLKADAVRIIAPVPGKGTVGVEVPNRFPKPVCMKEIVESKSWADSKAEIPVVLGKDVTGKAIVEDLTKMPHMLIAGSTGSGKTVCINAVIASLLYHAGPEDLRFIMVDPKVVEMQVYNDLPHMLIPVVTDPKKVPGALKYLINEMERRYQIFAKVGVRNIAGFNKKLAKDKEEQAKLEQLEREQGGDMTPEERAAQATLEVPRDDGVFEIPEKKLPYIVCIIDELADLMMVAPQDIETGVARLAQLARAAGIHLILATQRPSVNVITGVIKANLPTRISFKVASKVDSRTILDQQGADSLIGKGDMLFIPPGTSNLVRAQGAFVSDDEINSIVDYLKEQNGEPEYAEEVQQQIEAGDGDGGGGPEGDFDDELVPEAINIIKTHQRASTSFLQRKLKIGYNRAARIMEILEDEGIVGPDNGSSPREILEPMD